MSCLLLIVLLYWCLGTGIEKMIFYVLISDLLFVEWVFCSLVCFLSGTLESVVTRCKLQENLLES